MPACQDDLLGAVLEWAEAHLAEDISVELLARRALMSPRSFARRFKATTGTTPHAWLLGQRLAAAEALLEESDAPVEEIARLVGFGTAAGPAGAVHPPPRGLAARLPADVPGRVGAAAQVPGRRRCSSTGTGRGARGVGSDQALVEAELGQPA